MTDPTRTVLAAVTLIGLTVAGAPLVRPSLPVARVLEVKGVVTIVDTSRTKRPAAVYGSLYNQDRLVVKRDSMIVLGFRSNGRMVRVRRPGQVTVTEAGVDKTTGVESIAVPQKHQFFVQHAVMELRPITREAVRMLRDPTADASPWVNRSQTKGLFPIHESTVLSRQPLLCWPQVPAAPSYHVAVSYLGGARLWSASTTATSLQCTVDGGLPSGCRYTWQVTATLADDTALPALAGRFTIATDRQRAEAAQLAELIGAAKVPYLALAAMWYRQNGFIAEAIEVSRQITELQPDAASAHQALAYLLKQAGRVEEAQKALDRAMQVGPPALPPRSGAARARSIFGEQPD